MSSAMMKLPSISLEIKFAYCVGLMLKRLCGDMLPRRQWLHHQSDDSDLNICSVLLQIYSEGEATPVPGDNKQHALTAMLLPGTGPGFGLTVYL